MTIAHNTKPNSGYVKMTMEWMNTNLWLSTSAKCCTDLPFYQEWTLNSNTHDMALIKRVISYIRNVMNSGIMKPIKTRGHTWKISRCQNIVLTYQNGFLSNEYE